nr:type II toxin-antitoxin system RelE/ParE family toxin [uncultured Flavobacterium sp.]
MKITLSGKFLNKLQNQLDYISEDKPKAAQKFKKDIFTEIRQIVKMPYKHRVSIHFNDNNVREVSFKGYLVIYKIKPELNEIEVFGFIKYTLNP